MPSTVRLAIPPAFGTPDYCKVAGYWDLKNAVANKEATINEITVRLAKHELYLAKTLSPPLRVDKTGESAVSFISKTWKRTRERDAAFARNPLSKSPYLANLSAYLDERRKLRGAWFGDDTHWQRLNGWYNSAGHCALRAAQREIKLREYRRRSRRLPAMAPLF